jgi:hypothetical protein
VKNKNRTSKLGSCLDLELHQNNCTKEEKVDKPRSCIFLSWLKLEPRKEFSLFFLSPKMKIASSLVGFIVM